MPAERTPEGVRQTRKEYWGGAEVESTALSDPLNSKADIHEAINGLPKLPTLAVAPVHSQHLLVQEEVTEILRNMAGEERETWPH
jgi:hypothetical protein